MQKVEIYTRKFCGFCTAAKSLLSSKGVDFVEYDASWDVKLKEEMISRSGGGRTFPQIFVGETHVGGCDDLHALERAGNLDALLSGSAP